jgi:hypothetical protein
VAAYGDQTHPENRGKAAPVFIASVQPRPPELWKSRDPRQADRSPGSLRDCFGRGNPGLHVLGLLVL